jgi:hypothetical protein
LRPLAGRCGGAVCSRGGNAAEWDRGSVRAGGCDRVGGVARRGEDRGGGSRVVRDRCLDFLRALARSAGGGLTVHQCRTQGLAIDVSRLDSP